MELKEIVLNDATNRQKKNEIGFNLQSNLFTILLSEYLQGVTTDDVSYLQVNFIEKLSETKIDSYTVENGLTVQIPYNPIRFLELGNVEKKYQEYCRVMHEYVAPVFHEKGWDFAPVTQALDKIKEHSYKMEFLLKGTPKKSPDKKYTAIVVGVHEVTSFKLLAKIYTKGGLLVKEKELVEEVPNHFVYGRFLGKPEWTDNHTFQVSSKTSKWIGSVTVD